MNHDPRKELKQQIKAQLSDLAPKRVRPVAPVDARIQAWLDGTFGAIEQVPRLPVRTFALDEPGMARELSLPRHGDECTSPLLKSYRLRNGVLHNPASDRRTTKGVFHIVEGGLPVPDDKLGVPPVTFVRMLAQALQPPADLARVPYTGAEGEGTTCLVSLLLRPLVVPAVAGFSEEKRMEIRFFVPGSLVANLDFIESIFGNAGDPTKPENDAALNPARWTGHTGCVILAPHLTLLLKKDLGLPHYDKATERQRRDGMCWKTEDERYNGGSAFKICARDASGVIVTLIADNYFGYCKKEVKTQISYSANLFGLAEEEHAGGALVYPTYDLGEEFSGNLHVQQRGHSFAEVAKEYASLMEVKPEGYAVDREFPDIIYVAEDVAFDLNAQTVTWTHEGKPQQMPLRAGRTYVRPSGYKVHIEQPPGHSAWHLVGSVAEGTLCHKPCTVSGGGKSEISKPISDAILPGPVFVADYDQDMDRVAATRATGRRTTARF
jgi:phosphoenolpyruvate carboxykinase (diphosphate)